MHATHNAQSKRCRAQKNRATEHSKVKYNICVWYILNTAKYNTHIHVAKHPTTSTICTSKLEKTKLGQCGKSCYARRRIAAMHIAYTRRRGSNSERECTIIAYGRRWQDAEWLFFWGGGEGGYGEKGSDNALNIGEGSLVRITLATPSSSRWKYCFV